MYPTISDLIRELIGINIPLPIQTYGFFVAAAFLIGIFVLAQELKRKEKEGLLTAFKKKVLIGEPAKPMTLIITGIIGFFIGFKLGAAFTNYSEFVDNPQIFILSKKGSILAGVIFGALSVFWTWYEKNKSKLKTPTWEEQIVHPYELSGNILVIAGVAGILGAKLFHNLENIDDLIANPVEALISFSGLTFLGGLIIGSATVVYYCNKNNIKPLHLLDAAGATMPLAYGIGRIGCHLSGDGCWGIPNPNPKPGWMSFLPDWIWSFKFPHNVINEGVIIDNCTGKHCHILDVPVYPTSFYETVVLFIIFGILWSIRKKIKLPGLMFCFYLILQAIERYGMELIRVNNQYHFLGISITQAELISIIFLFSGIAGIFLIYKYRDRLKSY
jgi:phosphatidylglycerol---prolipoprotein diacylglyceryl transferase